jgi:hypothetical protein
MTKITLDYLSSSEIESAAAFCAYLFRIGVTFSARQERGALVLELNGW